VDDRLRPPPLPRPLVGPPLAVVGAEAIVGAVCQGPAALDGPGPATVASAVARRPHSSQYPSVP
jgi:hypothetical protein